MVKRIAYNLLIIGGIFCILFSNIYVVYGSYRNPTGLPQDNVNDLFQKLTPEEKIGQLFIAIFNGNDINNSEVISELITQYHIGGIMLTAANSNIPSGEGALHELVSLTRNLQLMEWSSAQQLSTNLSDTENISQNFIPLFIGISQEGGGYPNDQIINGVSPLPNLMAIGATWNPDLSEQVGYILGSELSSLGINMLIGPALDVLETPRPEGTIDLGTRSFGSDPFWVSKLGSKYIKGLNLGSNGKIAIIAKHFPGNGGSDRSPEEEVATVRKSLEQLKNYDLLPFFSVTGNANSPEETADGLLASHIRYQGFQENIRVTTRPISFDPQAFSLLMDLPTISSWRENGGIVVCDNLGSLAVRRFYELTGQTYDPRRVALNAFLAGNDLLYLGDITTADDQDVYTQTKRVINFFVQKYNEDSAFAQQVNESVLRILTLKLNLYQNFNLNTILPPTINASEVGQTKEVTFNVAREAATLISPTISELDESLPTPPRIDDRLIFFSDVRNVQQCSQCPTIPILGVDSFQESVKRLYGPQAGGQIWPANLSSYSFEDLVLLLNKDPNAPPIEDDIKNSDWIIFAMLNVNEQIPSSLAVKRFLSERPDLIQKKRLIVFAFDAPYYLDATNISKLTAYYGMYSNNSIFIEIASRILFRELLPNGALPVSVPGIGYDLITATSPNPNQIIPLYIRPLPTSVPITTTITPEPTAIPEWKIGETITLQTGVIYDHNGNPVPDGTPVQFITSISGETIFPQQETTKSGIASTNILISNSGSWEIRVESEPAKSSDVMKFDIQPPPGELVTSVPTETPTITPSPTITPTASLEEPIETSNVNLHPPGVSDWLIAIFISSLMSFITYRLSIIEGQVRWAIRGALICMIGGLIAYCYILIQLPGSDLVMMKLSSWGVFLISLFGSVLGILFTWGWRVFITERTSAN